MRLEKLGLLAQSASRMMSANDEAFMRMAIIGAGSVGATLGQAWLKHGEDVIWGLGNSADPKI
jgi:hypothetical protein